MSFSPRRSDPEPFGADPDASTPISAGSAKWFVSATVIEEASVASEPALVFGDELVIACELWSLDALRTSHHPVDCARPAPESRLVLLASPASPGYRYRSVAWCRFPYRADLLETSRFVPGRNRDDQWRADVLRRAFEEPHPIAKLKRDLSNVTDTSSARQTALFGAPEQRFGDLLFETIRDPSATQRGPIGKLRSHRVVRSNGLWNHCLEHPDLVPAGGRAAQLAGEFRWAILPALAPERSPEIEAGESPDFTLAKNRLLSERPIVRLLDDAQCGLLRIGDQRISLCNEVVERAGEIVEFAVERALCGPRDGRLLGEQRRVSSLARSIARYELEHHNQRWERWRGVISEPTLPPPPLTELTADNIDEILDDMHDGRSEGGGRFDDGALRDRIRRGAAPNAPWEEVLGACLAVLTLAREQGSRKALEAQWASLAGARRDRRFPTDVQRALDAHWEQLERSALAGG